MDGFIINLGWLFWDKEVSDIPKWHFYEDGLFVNESNAEF
jgi:hypothetical protein